MKNLHVTTIIDVFSATHSVTLSTMFTSILSLDSIRAVINSVNGFVMIEWQRQITNDASANPQRCVGCRHRSFVCMFRCLFHHRHLESDSEPKS